MSGEYKELIDRLAEARNHYGGSYILVTKLPDENNLQLDAQAETDVIILAVCHLIRRAFKQAEQERDITAQTALCDWLTDAVQENQAKRFQEGGVTDD